MELTPELEAKVKAAESLEEVVEILKAEGMDVTKEDLIKAMEAEEKDELSEDDLEDVAGGAAWIKYLRPLILWIKPRWR